MQSEKTKSFIERAVSIHGNKYDYSDVVYTSRIKGSPSDIWDMEKKLNSTLSALHYVPKIMFHGSARECFLEPNDEVCSVFGVNKQ